MQLQRFAVQSNYSSLTLTSNSNKTSRSSTAPASDQEYATLQLDRPFQWKENTFSQRSNDCDRAGGKQGKKPKILLIHDPPCAYSYDNDNRDAFESMFQFILTCSYPIVMIVSGMAGRDDFMYISKKILPESVKQRYIYNVHYFSV